MVLPSAMFTERCQVAGALVVDTVVINHGTDHCKSLSFKEFVVGSLLVVNKGKVRHSRDIVHDKAVHV